MHFELPDHLQYLTTHEWVDLDDDIATVGITDFAQDELGDVVFVELPEEGATFVPEEQFGSIESMKALSELYAPVGGTVTDVNDDLLDAPEVVNDDPYGDGWMLRLDVEDVDETALLTAEEYREQTE